MSKRSKQLSIMGTTFKAMGIFMLFLGLRLFPLATSGISIAPLITVLGTAIPTLVLGVELSKRAKNLKGDDEGDEGERIVTATTIAASPQVTAGANAPEGMLLKAENVVPALAGWMDHAGASEPPALLAMLDRTGVRRWAGAPAIRARQIGHTGRIWLVAEGDDVPAATYEAMVGIEAALAIRSDVRDQGLPATQEGIEAVLRRTCDLPLTPSGPTLALYEAYRPARGSDFAARLAFACAMEDLKTPFRLLFTFRESLSEHHIAVDLEIPTPASLAVASADPAVQVCAARAYALRVALLVARCALASSEEFARVIVNCHAHGSEDALLSLDLDAEHLDLLLRVARTAMVEGSAFPHDDNVRAAFGDDGWFVPIERFVEVDEVDADGSHSRLVELSEDPATPEIQAACGATHIRDLGILEEAARLRAWGAISGQLGTSTGDAVNLLSRVRDTTDAIDVAEACNRVIQALAVGSVDVEDHGTLRDLFVEGSALDTAFRAAASAMSDDTPPEEALALIAPLEKMLAEYDSTGLYLDDSEYVYRFFSSVAERVAYNLANQGDTRRVRLVPDAYYHARRLVCTVLCRLGEEEAQGALTHARELQRIAPLTVDADLAAVRAYERLSHYYAAADQLVESIEKATSAKFLAICFYRLAFMEWHLDDARLAAACYSRSLSFHAGDVVGNALEEMRQLHDEEGVEMPGPSEAAATLREAGIPLGDPDGLRTRHLKAAIACVDAGLHTISIPLFIEAFQFGGSDPLFDVFHSVKRDD